MRSGFCGFGRMPQIDRTKADSRVTQFYQNASKISQPPNNGNCLNLAAAIIKYLQNPTEVNALRDLKKSLEQLNRACDIPKTKGRLCGGLLSKGDKAYKCYECMTEQNSVLCPQCFELEKHVGHQYERFQVFGGCCDCGDIQKWKQEGFCKQHSQDQEIEIILDQKIVSLFLEEQTYALSIVVELYQKFKEFMQQIKNQEGQNIWNSNLKVEITNSVLECVDQVGDMWVDQLVQFNKAGKFSNQITSIFLAKEFCPKNSQNKMSNTKLNTVFDCLFSFMLFKKTPEKVTDLCITMFPMLDFRQKVTQIYIRLYNRDPLFPPSAYSHLSSQLLTSHMAVTKLVKEGRIEAIRYLPTCHSFQNIQKVCDGYMRYFYDIRYLSKLYGSAAVDYFKFHAQQKMFYSLGYYRVIFDSFNQAIDYYGLEEIFMSRMVPLIKVIQRDSTMEISNMVLRELYGFMTTQPTSTNNKYRPQQRIFSLVLFVRLNGDLELLQDQQTMNELMAVMGVNNFKSEMSVILANLRSVLLTAASLIQNSAQISSKYTFFSFYLRKSHFLFNLDSILLKVAIKMCQHHNKHHQPYPFEHILLEGANNPINIINSDDPIKSSSSEQEIQQFLLNQINDNILNKLTAVKALSNYIAILSQAMFSDLSELAIMCAIQPTDFELFKKYDFRRLPIEKMAHHYYGCLLRSEESNRVSIKQFKKTSEMFFKEQQNFKKFVMLHKDPTDPLKLVKTEENGPKMNLFYFRSLCGVTADQFKTGFGNPPYMKWRDHDWLNCFLEPIQQAISLIQSLLESKSIETTKVKGAYLPYLMIQLWKIVKLSESPEAACLLSQLQKNQLIRKQISGMGGEIYSVLTSSDNMQDEDESSTRRRELLKRKQQEKKSQMKQKMNKNSELMFQILQEEQIPHERSQVTNKDVIENVCCYCKDSMTEQPLFMQGFMTFTNGNRWLGIKDDSCIPIFDTCGHMIHLSCQKKSRLKYDQNRVYLPCPLCKNCANLLVPQKQNIQIQDSQTFIDAMKRVYNTLEYDLVLENVPQVICRSLAFYIIFKGFLKEKVFTKQIGLYQTIYKIYQNLFKMIEEKDPDPSAKDLPVFQQVPEIFKDITKVTTSAIQQKFIAVNLSNNFSQHLTYLVNRLKGENCLDSTVIQPPEVELIRSTIVLPEVEKNLGAMSTKFRGKCPQCGLVTNNQIICLCCPNFVSCVGCQKVKISTHMTNTHLGLGVYMKTSTGEVIYLMRSRFWSFQSLYQDYMGRVFVESSKHREQYNMNMVRYEEVRSDIEGVKIEQQVRYKECSTKVINNRQIH